MSADSVLLTYALIGRGVVGLLGVVLAWVGAGLVLEAFRVR